MVEQALRDPVTVGMLKVDGKGIMKVTGEKPGPRIGHMLHALLEEVLEDPEKNTKEWLEKRVGELRHMSDKQLSDMGKSGRERLEAVEADAVRGIEEKWYVADKGQGK